MKNKRFTLLALLASLFIAGSAQIYNVAPNGGAGNEGNPSLNEFIVDKDTSMSEPLTFILEMDGLYILTDQLTGSNDITIKADDGGTFKPVIVMGVNSEGGAFNWNMGFFNSANLTLDGIQFMCANELHSRGGWANGGIQIAGGVNVTINNCIIDHQDAVFIAAWNGGVGNFTFTNNLVRFAGGPFATNWHGYVLDSKGGPAGDIHIENNTFLEGMASVFTMDGSRYIKSIFINHNTFVNQAVWPFSMMYAKEKVMTNNLFVNSGFGGLSISWWINNCVPEEGRGIVDYCEYNDGEDTISYTLGGATVSNPVEEERLWAVAYNNNHKTAGLKAWQESPSAELVSTDTANGGGWWVVADSPAGTNGAMNATTWARFDDDATYPYLFWDDNSVYAKDVTFSGYTTSDDDIVNFARGMVMDPDDSYAIVTDKGHWGVGPDQELTLPVDADEYTLDYSDEDLLCAAMGGYPMGDLNWFPTQKAAWETDADVEDYDAIVAAVKDGSLTLEDQCTTIGISLSSANVATTEVSVYPNPATGLTTIAADLDNATNVSAVVYDIVGNEVLTLNNTLTFDASELNAGTYIVNVKANGVSGSSIFVVE